MDQRGGPCVSAGSSSPAREPFPCPRSLTPAFITPPAAPHMPPRPEPPAQLWPVPSPYSSSAHASPRVSVVTPPLRGLILSCHPPSQPVESRGGRDGGREEGREEEASVALPLTGDCWNADRSICHPLPSHTHLLSEGLTLIPSLSLSRPSLSPFLVHPSLSLSCCRADRKLSYASSRKTLPSLVLV